MTANPEPTRGEPLTAAEVRAAIEALPKMHYGTLSNFERPDYLVGRDAVLALVARLSASAPSGEATDGADTLGFGDLTDEEITRAAKLPRASSLWAVHRMVAEIQRSRAAARPAAPTEGGADDEPVRGLGAAAGDLTP